MDMDWDEDPRPTDVLLLEGTPLLGVNLLAGSLLQAEMTDGGEVSIELLSPPPLFLGILSMTSPGFGPVP